MKMHQEVCDDLSLGFTPIVESKIRESCNTTTDAFKREINGRSLVKDLMSKGLEKTRLDGPDYSHTKYCERLNSTFEPTVEVAKQKEIVCNNSENFAKLLLCQYTENMRESMG